MSTVKNLKVSDDVWKAIQANKNGLSMDSTLRRLLKLPVRPMRSKYMFLDKLGINGVSVIPWNREKLDQNFILMAVRNSSARSGNVYRTRGTALGLEVTRTA